MSALPFAAEVVAKATLLLAVAAALAFAIRRRAPAATRHALWAATLAALLVLPAAIALGPRWALPVLATPVPNEGAAVPNVARMPNDEPAAPTALLADGPPPRTVVTPRSPTPVIAAPARSVPASLPLLLWAFGVAICVARLVAGHVALRRLARRAASPDDTWRALLAEESARAGVRGVRLLFDAGVAAPATWGVRAPVVVFPLHARAWPESRRRVS